MEDATINAELPDQPFSNGNRRLIALLAGLATVAIFGGISSHQFWILTYTLTMGFALTMKYFFPELLLKSKVWLLIQMLAVGTSLAGLLWGYCVLKMK